MFVELFFSHFIIRSFFFFVKFCFKFNSNEAHNFRFNKSSAATTYVRSILNNDNNTFAAFMWCQWIERE
jgi:hypothetical protein